MAGALRHTSDRCSAKPLGAWGSVLPPKRRLQTVRFQRVGEIVIYGLTVFTRDSHPYPNRNSFLSLQHLFHKDIMQLIVPHMKNRRTFLKQSALAGASFQIVPRHVLGGPGYTPPSEKLTKAVIGCGGMGQGHLKLGGEELLAICDVDRQRLENTAKKKAGVDTYTDYREVLARPDIDVIHNVTPPHWHAIINVAAAEAGKDIWTEKPFSRTIGEGEAVVDAVQRNGRVLRINTWFRFDGGYYGFGESSRWLKKAAMHGLLGSPLRMTFGAATGFNWKLGGWSGKPWLPPEEVPAHFDYDTWLGPAPVKPYTKHRTHGSFRGYWDYDGGGLGDMGQHYLDPAQWILDKDHDSPTEIEVDTVQQHHDAVLPWRRVVLRYKDGTEIVLDDHVRGDIPTLEGPRGKIYSRLRSDIPNLRRKLEQLPDPAPRITDFSESIRTRKKFALNEENGHRSCTLINLALAAIRLGRNLKFDPEAQRFPDDPAANALIHQPMRAPYTIQHGVV